MANLTQLERDVERHEDDIKELKSNVIDIQKESAKLDMQLCNLAESIGNLASIIKWLVGLGFTSLLGFFMFIIQTLVK